MPNSSPTLNAGAWCMLGESLTTAHIARAGFDWICLDQQHGAFDDAATLSTVRALHALSHRPEIAIRVGDLSDFTIGRALDAGADIVIVPMVESVAQARAAAQAAHYPPRGRRSWGPLQTLWGADAPSVTEARPRLWVMIETRAGLSAVDEILAVDGIDGIFVGPFDLSLALGTDVASLLQARGAEDPLPALLAAAQHANSQVGVFAGEPEMAATLHELGFSTIALTTDAHALARGASAVQKIALGSRQAI